MTVDTLKNSPSIDEHKPVSREYENLFKYFVTDTIGLVQEHGESSHIQMNWSNYNALKSLKLKTRKKYQHLRTGAVGGYE